MPPTRQDSIRLARHMAVVVENTCTHDGLFYTSTLPINGKQYCGRCGRNVPQYDL